MKNKGKNLKYFFIKFLSVLSLKGLNLKTVFSEGKKDPLLERLLVCELELFLFHNRFNFIFPKR